MVCGNNLKQIVSFRISEKKLNSKILTKSLFLGLSVSTTTLRDTATRFSTSGFFHESIFPNPGKFVEIFAAQGAPPVSLTPVANGKKTSIRKVLIILCGPFMGLRKDDS
jgi:hypothetical protein